MVHTLYFADKQVIFTDRIPSDDSLVLQADDIGRVSRAKIGKILETSNRIAVVAADPDAAFERFAADFARVEAAGGIVVDERGERLMIYRNGRWDLPKGHVEAGERLERCAAREAEEETGVSARVVRPLCETLHAYFSPWTNRWELKRTSWFELRATGGEPKPQTEEGIERVEWCTPRLLEERAAASYPTIRRVVEAMADGR